MLKEEYLNIFKNQENHWWFKGMEEINFSLLNHYLKDRKNLKILDAGCGPGVALSYLKKYGQVIGVDKSEEALKYAQKKGRVQKADIANLPFKKESFDLIVCLDVLYHVWVKDYQKVLEEFGRVLKKKGLLLLREPAYNWLQSSHDLIDFTRERFCRTKIEKGLNQAGFKILKLSYINFFLFPVVVLKRLPEILKIKKKRPKSDIFALPPLLNFFLFSCLRLEAFLLKYINFPFGSSVVCLAQRYARIKRK